LPFFTATVRRVVSSATPEQPASLHASATLVFPPASLNLVDETTIRGDPTRGRGRLEVAVDVVATVAVVAVFVVVVPVVVVGGTDAATPSLKMVPKRSDIAGVVVVVTVTVIQPPDVAVACWEAGARACLVGFHHSTTSPCAIPHTVNCTDENALPVATDTSNQD